MPAGFQSINNSNALQIDGEYSNLSLIRSGSVTPVKDNGYGSGPNTYNATVFCNPAAGEIVAVSSINNFTLYWTTSDSHVYRVNGNAEFKYYVFAKVTASGANFGMQVFKASGEISYCATWRPFNVAGVISSAQSFTAGRSYAAIFLSLPATNFSQFTWIGGGQIIYAVVQQYDTAFAAISANSISVSAGPAWQVMGEGVAPPAPPPNFSYTNGLPLSIMVLDVTGY